MGLVGRAAPIDELLDRAVVAINRGDRATATVLAEQVLAVDHRNADAEDLLAAPGDVGEIRRLTILFADLSNATALSARIDPEAYRMVVRHYREQVCKIVNRYEGHLGSTKGEALLAVFGHPTAHEDDARRAVLAGLEIAREAANLSEHARRRLGESIDIRVGVHRGLVYLDIAQDDVYGLAANVAARVCSLASPGALVVSDAVEPLVRHDFELQRGPSAAVKGVDGVVVHYRVLGERVGADRFRGGPLVGRHRERARLQKSWARAQAATLTTPGVVFRGEPGIGKSRLATAAVELVEGSGAVVLELHGSPFHTDAGLHPVRIMLERRCGISRLTEPGERLALLEHDLRAYALEPAIALPFLAPVLGVGPEAGYEPVPAEGRKLYELITQGVRDYLLACLGGGAGLIVAEDMHWFDPSTVEVLDTLLGAADGRLLVVITGRGGDWLPGGWPVKVFDLTSLSDEHTDELILALDPTATADERAAVRTRCDGVPFYIEQVVGAISAARSEAPGRTGVPEPLYEPLFARLRATRNVVEVVKAAAIIGRQVDRGLLRAVCTLSEDDIDDVIDDLENAMVFEAWGADTWRFRHELLRELGAELVPPSVRCDLHARVANALVTGAAGDPDWRLVAAHYEQAERFEDAAAAYQQASAAARRRGALAEARSYMNLALAGLERCAAGPHRDQREIAMRLERGLLAAAAEFYTSPAVAADFERCLQVGGMQLHDDEAVATLIALVSYCATRADLPRMAQVLDSLEADLTAGRLWCRPAVDSSFGVLAWLRGEFDAAVTYFTEATAGRAPAGQHPIEAVWYLPNEPLASAHLHLSLIRMWRGDLVAAEAELGFAARRAAHLGFPQGGFMECFGRFMATWVHIEAQQLDQAAALSAELIEQAERQGFDQWRLAGMTNQGAVAALVALASADHDQAALEQHIATMTMLLDTWRAVGLDIYLTFYDAVLGRLLSAAGKPDLARGHLDSTLRRTATTGMHFYDAELLRWRARAQPDPRARRSDIAAALQLARSQGAALLELRAALDDFEFCGQSARSAVVDVAGRVPNTLPEQARARAALRQAT
ncbi:adenylate/guanylate cyclase domain-containing protein [Mycobacterium sp. 852002-51057_SCH5723018]|uniref:adenylate/guanylate cyclase domain-containing protein n=1 Tax=Mycobacterium sp. 852002-51057_SCH5723018 TaxID=1834094 RepID=UPI00080017C8|nr:adenylate/guanylate cyclase domain-containing protein [Mycobacterium sp. 852002-51057_SCH5723018]OBG30222.1 cyclase [Mycobacterium sp. 852002-51057_SCH5723018]